VRREEVELHAFITSELEVNDQLHAAVVLPIGIEALCHGYPTCSPPG